MDGGFDSLLKTACNIKSTYLNQDKKKFNSLPEFYKTGLYVSGMTKNIRTQCFHLKKCSFEMLKLTGYSQIKSLNYDDAHYTFCKALSIFRYIVSSNPKWKTDGGIKDEELTYHEDKGNNSEEKKEIEQMIVTALLNISFCDLKSEKFDEVRNACEEVLKYDNSNVKA